MRSYDEFRETEAPLSEATASARYSSEINYRTSLDETQDNFAKIVLGFVSAACKNLGFHTKLLFEQPFRIFVSTRNWDEGEWVVALTWHRDRAMFVLSKGFWNKARKSMSVQNRDVARGRSAAELTREVQDALHSVKGLPDRHHEPLNPVPLKRGPKKTGSSSK